MPWWWSIMFHRANSYLGNKLLQGIVCRGQAFNKTTSVGIRELDPKTFKISKISREHMSL